MGSFGVYLSTISRSTKISNNEKIFFCRGDKSVRHSIFGSQDAPLLCHSTREGWMEGMGGYIGNLTWKGMTCLTGKKVNFLCEHNVEQNVERFKILF